MLKYSKDGLVSFDPVKHEYYRGETRLQGITTFISQFKNKFDPDGTILKRSAMKARVTPEVLAAKWKRKGELSAITGSMTHKVFEDYFDYKKLILPKKYPAEVRERFKIKKADTDLLKSKVQVAKKFIEDIFETGRLIPVATEMIVYNDDYASQIDFIAKNPEGEHFILDWKTNEKIDKVMLPYHKFMLGDFCGYPDLSFYHYSIQLSVYEKLCKEYEINKSYIVHIGTEDYEIIPIQKINLYGKF